jgi:hypothetical protein
MAISSPSPPMMSLVCTVSRNMPAKQTTTRLKANIQQRTTRVLSAQERPRHRKWLSATSATETTLRPQNPTNSSISMYRGVVKKYALSIIHEPIPTQPTALPINFGHVI